MHLLASAWVLAVLPSCGDPEAAAKRGADDAGDTGALPSETGDSSAEECALPASIEGPTEALPGEEVALALAGGVGEWSATWSTESGSVVASEEKDAAVWTLPDEIATYGPEIATVSATIEGCGETSTLAWDVTADWPDARRVVVVYDPLVSGSEDVARYYAGAHGIGDDALCAVSASDSVTLPGEDFPDFAATVQACIDAVGAHVWYLVPVWGVPYKVSGRIADIGSGAVVTTSLDAMLVYGAGAVSDTDAVWNTVYQDGDSPSGTYDPYVPFGELREIEDRRRRPYYLVARIDGASAEAAMDLVDRGVSATALADAGALEGVVYADGRFGDDGPGTDELGSYEYGDWNIQGTRRVFEGLGWYDVVWDGNEAEFGTDPAPLVCPDALYYAGWYSYYHYNDVFTWAPGAVGGHLDSCSACDIRAEGTWSGSALARGITATFGAVNEPYVIGMPEYDQFFLYLTQGASFGEAAYESTVIGLWMMVWVGDPLYRPYPGG